MAVFGEAVADVPDAILLVSFGGPEAPDEVLPFLERVTAGRDIPRARLDDVAEHYFAHGGRSPINDQNRALLAAVRARFAEAGLDLPIYWGNRNWHPFLADTLRTMRDDGVKRALCFVTAAYSSHSSCRQYREDLAAAQADVGADAPALDKIRVFYNHPGFIGAQRELVDAALAQLDDDVRDDSRIVFVTHSIPHTMARHSDYEAQHLDACRLVMEDFSHDWDLVYCSRSGPPHVAWLEPDINDHLRELASAGTRAAVVVPIGFVSDHMEVIHDLDVEAREIADDIELRFARAATVGTHPLFVDMVLELVRERIDSTPARALGIRGPSYDVCPTDCCAIPLQPNPPAIASAE
ncbi:MAG: ferrochelatase [Nitriliruptoraceae bacterium]